jgi:hypothetical protein
MAPSPERICTWQSDQSWEEKEASARWSTPASAPSPVMPAPMSLHLHLGSAACRSWWLGRVENPPNTHPRASRWHISVPYKVPSLLSSLLQEEGLEQVAALDAGTRANGGGGTVEDPQTDPRLGLVARFRGSHRPGGYARRPEVGKPSGAASGGDRDCGRG